MRLDPIFPLWVMAAIIIPVGVYLVWKEWRLRRRFQALRCVSVVVMLASVTGLMVHPWYQSAVSTSIILLTPDYSKVAADSILDANPGLTLMHTEDCESYRNSKELSYNTLPDLTEDIQFVLGQGLPTYALDLLRDRDFSFFPSTLPHGIVRLLLPKATMNRKHFVEGSVNTPTDSVVVLLNGPGGHEDSVVLPNKGVSNFRLSFVPKHAGNFLYEIAAEKDAMRLKSTVPIHVEAERNLNILFVLHYPAFEVQYLKSFLAKKKHGLVLRYQVSKNTFRFEYLNHDAIPVNRLTSDMLDGFDLVITDGSALAALSLAERRVIQESVQSGLGLLNLSPLRNKPGDLAPIKTISVKTDTAVLRVGQKLIRISANTLRILPGPSVTAVWRNKSGILAGYTFEGAGKIAYQFFRETYELALSGDSSAYSEVWSALVEDIAKPQAQRSKLRIVSRFPHYANEPLEIQLLSTNETPVLLDDRIRLPLKEDGIVDGVWDATTWGGANGWHVLKTEDGASLPYYVSPEDNLRSLAIANQMHENKRAKKFSSNTSDESKIWKEVPRVFFYALFLISAGFLWLAPKL